MAERPEFTGPNLCAYEAHEVVGLLERGEVSPQELLEASLKRCLEVEPAVNALPTLCFDRAKQALNLMPKNSLLSGVPIAIKDLMAVGGVRTTYGTKGLADNVPVTSEPLVERLEANGAVVVGKSNVPELARVVTHSTTYLVQRLTRGIRLEMQVDRPAARRQLLQRGKSGWRMVQIMADP